MKTLGLKLLGLGLLLVSTAGCTDALLIFADVAKKVPGQPAGTTDQQVPNVLPTTSNLSFAKVPVDLVAIGNWYALSFNDVYAVQGNKMAYTSDAGRTWKYQQFGTLNLSSVFFLTPSIGWVADHSGNIAITRDGGSTWRQSSIGVSGSVYRLAFTDETHGFAYMFGGIYVSSDGGLTWSQQPALETSEHISYLASVAGSLYFGGSNELVYGRPAKGWVWQNGAFTPLSGGNTFTSVAGSHLYTFGGNGNAAGSRPGVARLAGTTFTPLADPQPNYFVSGVAEDQGVLRVFGVGSTGASYIDSRDNGRTWLNPVPMSQFVPGGGQWFPYDMRFFDIDKGWAVDSGGFYRMGS